MALESAGKPYGQDGFALNIGTDGDLSRNWVMLNNSIAHGGTDCPTIRHLPPPDGRYYIFGGSEQASLVRSYDLRNWEAAPWPFITRDPPASLADGKVSPFYAEFWAGEPSDSRAREYIANMSAWAWGRNDPDVWDSGEVRGAAGSAPLTYLYYGISSQGAPHGWTGRGAVYNGIAAFNGTLAQLFHAAFGEPS